MAEKKSNTRTKSAANKAKSSNPAPKTTLKTNRLFQLLLGLAFIGIAVYLFWLLTQKIDISADNLNDELGLVGAFIYRSMSSIAGGGKMVIPVFFLVFGANFISPKYKLTGFQIFGILFSYFMILGIIHLPLAFGLNSIRLGWMGAGGGAGGAVVAWCLAKAFGKIGGYIVAYILLILGIVLSSKGYIFRWIRASLKKARLFGGKVAQSTSKIILEEVPEDSVSYAPKETAKKLPQAPIKAKIENLTEKNTVSKPFIINNLQEIQQDISENKKGKEKTSAPDANTEQTPVAKAESSAVPQNKHILSEQDAPKTKLIINSAAINPIIPPVETVTAPKKEEPKAAKKEQPAAKASAESEDKPAEFVPQSGAVAEYHFPALDLLETKGAGKGGVTQDEIQQKAALLDKTLADFGVKGHISEVSIGPAITRYEFQPASGVKVSKIVNLADDIALNLAASGIRIEAPIPGKAAVGIEVPNKETSMVLLKDIIEAPIFKDAKSKLTVALGKDIAGQPIVTDLGKMPHLLIAGSTGSGKSVCMNTLIVSILYKAKPDEVKFLMVDPKMVELGNYNGIPHLISPVVTDVKKAASALRWAVVEMERRYELFANTGNKDIARYNKYAKDKIAATTDPEEKEKIEILPYIVILIDELADLMMVAPADVEDAICRLAQMARAAGMHLVVATQRPSVDVITGIIKANIPSRIAFAVSSQIDSRTILDMGGAEKLLGKGDMLFYPSGMPKPIRVQGVYVSDKEIDRVVEAIKEQGKPVYNENIGNIPVGAESEHKNDEDEDELIPEACKIFIENGQASISVLQRRFRIGYNRAARIIDQMEQKGMVGPYEGSKPRQVKITLDEYYQLYGN